MSRIRFSKLHGAGNDLVLVDCLAGDPADDWGVFARRVLDRRFGVGGDQLLLLRPSRRADFSMAIYNADGSEASMCVNGIRAFYKYLRDRGHTQRDAIAVETPGGIVRPRWLGADSVEVQLPAPQLDPEKIPTRLAGAPPLLDVPLEADGRSFRGTPVSMGNPHFAIFVDDPDAIALERVGPLLERHPAFPERANIEFAAVRSRTELVQRTWERGSGETLACGSGACAVAVAAILSGRAERELVIRLRGGTLRVRWPEDGGPVWLTGPAAHVFDGEIEYP